MDCGVMIRQAGGMLLWAVLAAAVLTLVLHPQWGVMARGV